MSSPDLRIALIRKFDASQWALMFEVQDGAGFGWSRRADALAFNLWPSRGLELWGMEIKSNRGDWLNELKNPAKADVMFKFCDRFYVVADGENIVHKGEVPKTWGLFTFKHGKLFEDVKAPKLKPKPLSRSFIASLLRRAQTGKVSRDEIRSELAQAKEEGRHSMERKVSQAEADLHRLQKHVDIFEKASGIRIGEWEERCQQQGEAVKFLVAGGLNGTGKRIETLKQSLDSIRDDIGKVLTELKSGEVL